MKKIYQRIDDPRHGDCYKCCIAAILDLEYEDVPHFIEMGENWFLEAQKFFKEHGYNLSGKELFNSIPCPISGSNQVRQKINRYTILYDKIWHKSFMEKIVRQKQ